MNARRLAHTLRGMAATLGAIEVESVAASLEAACIDAVDAVVVGERLDDTINKLDSIVATLQHVLSRVEPARPDIPKPAELRNTLPKLHALRTLLLENNLAAQDVMASLMRPLVALGHESAASEISFYIQRYEFDVAVESLDRLIGKVGIP
jgi:chemotaxis protein histidine kinase CheA